MNSEEHPFNEPKIYYRVHMKPFLARCPEAFKPSSRHFIQFVLVSVLIFSYLLPVGLSSDLFPLGLRIKFCMHLTYFSLMLYACVPFIMSSMIRRVLDVTSFSPSLCQFVCWVQIFVSSSHTRKHYQEMCGQ